MGEVESIIAAYFENKKDVSAVYLFGSYAAGKQKPFSDIDIGILLKHDVMKTAAGKQTACIIELGRMLRKDVHPVILNTAGETLLEQIFKYGKCILVNDEKEYAKFRMISLSKILDFSYSRSQIQSVFLNRMLEGNPDG